MLKSSGVGVVAIRVCLSDRVGACLRIVCSPGWAFAEAIISYLAPLWIGARGVEFDWANIQMGMRSNVGLVGGHMCLLVCSLARSSSAFCCIATHVACCSRNLPPEDVYSYPFPPFGTHGVSFEDAAYQQKPCSVPMSFLS